MRIGHFVTSYPRSGGSGAVVRDLATALAQLGHDQYIFTLAARSRAESIGKPSSGAGINVVARSPWRLFRLIAGSADRIDVLIIHSMLAPEQVVPVVAASMARIPIIMMPHGVYDDISLRDVYRKMYFRCIERPQLNRADAVHCFSRKQAILLRQLRVFSRVFIAPNGLRWQPAPRIDGPSKTGPPVVGYLGRLDVSKKGLDLLLEAAPLVAKREQDVRFVIAGHQKAFDSRAAAMKHRWDRANNIHFVGHTNQPKRFLSSVDLLAVPSRSEGFGLVALEALAVGTPVVVSRGAGVSEWLTNFDGVVPVDPNTHSIRDGILVGLSSTDVEVTTDDRTRLLALFDWTKIAQTWDEQIRHILKAACR